MNRRRGVAAMKNRQEKVQRMAQRGEQLQKDDIAHLEEQEWHFNLVLRCLTHTLLESRETQLFPSPFETGLHEQVNYAIARFR